MRVLSLFDGMACGYEALQRAGIPIDVYYAVSDTQRYKMLGNGWTVDVISHILSFIK